MTSDLRPEGERFLANSDWASAEVAALTQDASARKYFRLTKQTRDTAILMDASQAPPEEMARFLKIGRHLRKIHLSAPEIYAEAPGFLVLEDFGDLRFADMPGDQGSLYPIALDAVLHLQAHPAPQGLPICDAAHLGELAATAWQWYAPESTGERDVLGQSVADLVEALANDLLPKPSCLMLRDYHAENIMWLPQRNGTSRAGLLDFQDAMLGHPAFDVVSLLQDARRDISPDFELEMCTYFRKRASISEDEFTTTYAALGAIRNLRIIGMFARLSRLLRRPSYVDFIPRVWAYLERDLAHPDLNDLRKIVDETLPFPAETHLNFLRTECLTPPPQ